MKLSESMEYLERQIQQQNLEEIQNFKIAFEEKNPPNPIPKYSKEYFETMKILEGVIKQKE